MIVEINTNIELSSDKEAVRKNKELIQAEQAKLAGPIAVLKALYRANQEMCPHTGMQSYYDYGGGYNSCCGICGYSS